MYRLILIALLAISAASARCEIWTLDSCVDYAIEHNINVRISRLNITAAEQSVDRAKSGYLPTVSANAGESVNLGRGLTAENTYADRSTSTFNWGVSGNIQLFDGLATPRRIASAKASLRQITEQSEAAKDDVAINVTAAYLQALYTMEMHDVAGRQVELSEYELTRRHTLLEAGKIPEVDIYEAESQLAADRLTEVQAYNDMMLARIELMQLLHLECDASDFEIASLEDEAGMIIPAEETFALAMEHNHTIMAARRGIDVASAGVAVARTGYYPTVSFGTSIGSSYYNVSGMPNEGFGDQMKHNYSTYFGLQVNIPIYDGRSTRNSIKQAEVEKLNAELQLEQAEQELLRAIRQAYYQAAGAQKKLESSIVSEHAAQKTFEAMSEKYAVGRAQPTEYIQAKTAAYRATADRIQAQYELILRTRILQFYAGNSEK